MARTSIGAAAAVSCLFVVAHESTPAGTDSNYELTSTVPAVTEEWERHAFGEFPPDGGVVGGVVDGNPIVVHGAEGRLVSWVLSHGEFVATESPVAPSGTVLSDLAAFGELAILVGSDNEHFLPRVWTSVDGSAWTEVATTGLDRPADMLEVSAAPDALYAAGLFREGLGTASEHFLPAIWRSTDAQHWEAVTAPGPAGNGDVTALVVGADSVIVAMNVDDAGSIWRSADSGATWTSASVVVASESPDWRVESIARLGDRLVGVGTIQDDMGGAPLVVVSTDDGATWASPSEPVLAGEGGESGGSGGSVVAAAGAFWIATSEYSGGFSNPDACYLDLEACQSGVRPVLMRSTDGVEWVEIDLATLSASWIERVVDLAHNGVMLVGRANQSPQLETWTWSSDGEPPVRPSPGELPANWPPLAAHGDQLTVGATY